MWASLPEDMDALALLNKAIERGVAYVPGTHFYANGGHVNTFRLNFSAEPEERIREGIKRLGDLLKEMAEEQK